MTVPSKETVVVAIRDTGTEQVGDDVDGKSLVFFFGWVFNKKKKFCKRRKVNNCVPVEYRNFMGHLAASHLVE